MTVERLEVQRMIEAGAVGGQDRGPGVRPLGPAEDRRAYNASIAPAPAQS